MLFAEMKRKYANIVFLFVIFVGGWWLYSAIRPSATTASYDVYRYFYYKPLSKVEFTYFNLTKDYQEGTTIAYSMTDEQSWSEYTLRLNDTTKQLFLAVIRKMNPDYKPTEKMNDVTLHVSMDEIKPDLKNLEKHLKVPSFYYTGMYAPETYNQEYDLIDSQSPYWFYLECGERIFLKEEYEQKKRDFAMMFTQGISNGYAYVSLDYLGILMGVLSLLYSFQSYSEDKRVGINGFLYTEKISSAQHVLSKYVAVVLPLMALSFIYMAFAAGCFVYWNDKFAYGYSVDIFTFLEKIPLILFPTIWITVAISQFLGVLIQKEIINAVFQFAIFYLSMSGVPKQEFSLNTMIRFGGFDDYTFYNSYFKYLPSNRFFMIVLSILFVCLAIVLFEYRKEHEKLLGLERIRNRILIPVRETFCWRDKRRSTGIKPLSSYIIGQSVHKSALLYLPYLCVILPIVMTKNMDTLAIATIGENILLFASLFLFVRLGNMEKNHGMESQVFTAKMPYPLLYLLRVCVAGGVLFAMVEIPLGVLCFWNHVHIGWWCIGVYLSSLFIGLLSLFFTEVLENSFAGYFIYIMYYFLDTILSKGMLVTLSGYTKQMAHTKLFLTGAIMFVLLALTICVHLKTEGIRLTNRYGNTN